ncbi:MAG: PQQ-binding-like beta-propeller repeat protein [Planctomycetota bacterium]|nr:PQQ-binding-like beta-propeller repeat protein [Planctomycetota bacterium]
MFSINTRRIAAACATLFLIFASAPALFAADWPSYKHDSLRSSFTDDALTFPLRLAWQFVSPQPPTPAWPDTFRLLNHTDFDYAPHPVIAGGIVCFASADDTVRALDAATGQEKWHFIAGGPVRLTPQIEAGKVYFGCDDGFAYCLDAATGKVVWKFQGAPRDERMVGNHRMISRWPVRTGVLVADGVAYFCAGSWSTEGVFVYALKADSGQVVWCNDTLGFANVGIVDFPAGDDPRKQAVGGHNGEFAANGAVGSNPQGHLFLSGDVLVIPNGNSAPTALDRRTGMLSGKGAGGRAPLTIDQGKIYGFYRHHEDVLTLSPFALGNEVTPRGWAGKDIPQAKILPPKLNQIHDRTKVTAVVHGGKPYARVAYGVALAGETLLMGEENSIVAQDPDTERVLWHAPVTGEAREIAVAGGRLYVGTSSGAIYCFATAVRGSDTAPVIHDPAAAIRAAAPKPLASDLASAMDKTLEQLRRAGMDRGFALVVGDADGQVSANLAANSQLRVICVSTDEAAAAALRERLLTQTTFHGPRVQVHVVKRLDQLPFAQFFANAVVVAGPTPGTAPGLTPAVAKELYRVLHPCGGVLAAPGLKPAEADKLWSDSGALEAEAQKAPEARALSRGKLPGALDWDSQKKTGVGMDQRVKWPLRPLWYGGPGTVQVQAVAGGDGPVVANGRYFVIGEQVLTAVDAYNGEILWTHLLPRGGPSYATIDGVVHGVADTAKFARGDLGAGVHADDDYVYLSLGPGYFQAPEDETSKALGEEAKPKSKGEGVIQLDARTGAQMKIAAPFNPPSGITLTKPQKWTLEVDPRRSGVVAMESTDKGLVLTLTTKDPLVTKLDAWDLYFDFRPPDTRYGLYERGTFRARVVVAQDKNTPPTWSSGSWAAEQSATPHAPVNPLPDPVLQVTGTREPTGTKTVVVVPWDEVVKLVGAKPTTFGFAASLSSHDGGREEPIEMRHLFCDWSATGMNNGWACIALDEKAAAAVTVKRPSIFVDAIKTVANNGGNGDYITPARAAPRVHPITGDLEPKMFRKGGCGGLSASAAIRSGSQSIYDFEDDSGMRPVGGIKTRCSSPQIVALGLLIYSEEAGHCECPYPIRTTLVMAPAEHRLNEDWAFFFARPADTYLRQAAINLGAPGDRRDNEGTLWLGFPRIPADKSVALPIVAGNDSAVGANGVWMRVMSAALQLPVEVECFPDSTGSAYKPTEDVGKSSMSWVPTWTPARNHREFGPYRVNADRVEYQKTDRGWLYSSGYRGIKKASVKLDFLQPVVSAPAAKPLALPDKLEGPEWKGAPQSHLPFTQTDIFVRHDAENLYVVARRPAVIDRLGNVSRWTKATKGEDAPVWEDDSFEVFLSDAEGAKVVHLGVSASGARYDALSQGGKKEDPAWNGEWRSAALAEQTEASLKAAITPTNPVPDEETLVKINTAKPSEAGDISVKSLDPDAPPKKPAGATKFRGAEPAPLVIELAIPWKTLEAAGLKRDRLSVNLQTNQKDVSGMPPSMPGSASFKPTGTSGEALSYLGIEGRSHCQNFAPLGVAAAPPSMVRPFTVRLHFAEPDDVKPGQRVFDVKLQDQVVLKDFDVAKEAGGVRTALVKEFKGIRASGTMTLEFVPSGKELKPDNAPILNGIEVYDEGFKVVAVK